VDQTTYSPVPEDGSRRELRGGFDADAEAYDRTRPVLPGALFDDLLRAAGLRQGDRVVEIGCGTGQAPEQIGKWHFPDEARAYFDEVASAASGNVCLLRRGPLWANRPGTLVSGGSCAGGPAELTLDGFEPAGEVGKRAGILVG
jgi:hypothetical protein